MIFLELMNSGKCFKHGKNAKYAYLIGAAIAETGIKYAKAEHRNTMHRLLQVVRSYEYGECTKTDWEKAADESRRLYFSAEKYTPDIHACEAIYIALNANPTNIIGDTSYAVGSAAAIAEQSEWINCGIVNAERWGYAVRCLAYEEHIGIINIYMPYILGEPSGLMKCAPHGRRIHRIT